MAYLVKEIFYTLQGEGAQAGRPAVFCRFSVCNLWSGRPEDRATAKCRFCDTDFVGADAGVFATAEELAQTIAATFPVLDPQAVSYTHLDVYKRQGNIPARNPPSPERR